jgi:hypothetical protein
MDSHSGLLMAVKQVELGKNRTSVRTKGMVDALEREIELLKELQHDNIVQYLGQSSFKISQVLLTCRLIDRWRLLQYFPRIRTGRIRRCSPKQIWCIRRSSSQAIRPTNPYRSRVPTCAGYHSSRYQRRQYIGRQQRRNQDFRFRYLKEGRE